MSQARPGPRVCGACRSTRLSGYNPDAICGPCQRALFAEQNGGGRPGGRDEMAAWVWDAGVMRDALARLDFPAVLVIYRSAAGLSQAELAGRTGFSQSAIWYWEARKRQGIYDIRQLLQFADAVRMPRQALLPVILGHPGGLPAGPGEVPSCAMAGVAGHG
jgi:hypothetical protein